MKNPVFLISIMVSLSVHFAKAQDLNNNSEVIAGNTITKGTKIIGGSIEGSAQINKNYQSTSLGLSTGYGQFISNRILISGGISMFTSQSGEISGISGSTYTLGAAGGLDYYFLIRGRSAYSIGGGLGIYRSNSFFDKEEQSNGTFLNGELSLKYNYFITSYLAFNCGIYYSKQSDFSKDYNIGGNNSNTYNDQGVSLGTGFSWFIPSTKPQEILNQPYASNTITKGTKVIDGGIGADAEMGNGNNSLTLELSPSYGQFITNRLLLSGGISLTTGLSWSAPMSGINIGAGYGVNAGLGYYFYVKNRTAWALSTNIGFGRNNMEFSGDQYNITSVYGGLSLSYYYFLTPFVALNATLNYQRDYDFETYSVNNPTSYNSQEGRLLPSLGLSWFLTSASK